jgi:methylated-DNA-[protein]-cysteine S-methyltransferase
MAGAWEVADVPTPIGTFRIVYQGKAVRIVDLLEAGLPQTGVPVGATRRKAPFPTESPPRQLSEYFKGDRATFDLDIDPESGSTFDRTVWQTLSKIPAGRTVTYGELAKKSGHQGSARAVGGSMHRNPIPIIIPCHRVVGEGGSLQGFGLGLWRKRWLLDHEGAWPLRSKSAEGPRDRAQRTLDGPTRPRGKSHRVPVQPTT